MDLPDITLVQKLVAAVTSAVVALGTVLTLFGVATAEQAGAVAGAVAALGGVYVAADAVIRNGRARALANPESIRELERPKPPSFNE